MAPSLLPSGAPAGSWSYHPLEVVVRPSRSGFGLAERLAAALAREQRIGFVRHGAAVVVAPCPATGLVPGEAGPLAGIAVNGRESRFDVQGHLDLPTQRILLSDMDLVVVEGALDSTGPVILELDPDGSGVREALERGGPNLLAVSGPSRPVDKLPPGGIPWFPPDDLPGLVDHVRDHLDAASRARPVWAIQVGTPNLDPSRFRELEALVVERCGRSFADPASLPEDSRAEPLPSEHPGLGELGQILTALERHPGVAFLVLRGDEDPALLDGRLRELFHLRDPYRAATAYRERDTHLPRLSPSIWESKSRLRIHLALAVGVRCPQRVLTHSHLKLLEPLGS